MQRLKGEFQTLKAFGKNLYKCKSRPKAASRPATEATGGICSHLMNRCHFVNNLTKYLQKSLNKGGFVMGLYK